VRPYFDVFLSHNSKDKPAVREIAMMLKTRGLHVWLDEWELVPGRPWQDALEQIVEEVGSAAILVGRDGLGPWEAQEMRALLSELVDRKLPVIPVLLPGAPDSPELPIFLRQLTWVDLRGGIDKDGLDRLVWGIRGVKPAKEISVIIRDLDGNNHIAEVSPDTLVGDLMHAFLAQCHPGVGSTIGPQQYQLWSDGPESQPLPPASTLQQAGVVNQSTLALHSEKLNRNEPVSLTVEDDSGHCYSTAVLLSTTIRRLAESFLDDRPGEGEILVEDITRRAGSAARSLQLDCTLFDAAVADDAVLRIYRAESP
jgi:hypothetical protein